MKAYHEITQADVARDERGQTFRAFGKVWPTEDFIGRLLPGDVGKRVYQVAEGVLQVENEEQRAERLSARKWSGEGKIFRLYVDADNAAFDEMGSEIARILRECANRIEREGVGFPSQTVRDVNGNDVGRYALKTLQQWEH